MTLAFEVSIGLLAIGSLGILIEYLVNSPLKRTHFTREESIKLKARMKFSALPLFLPKWFRGGNSYQRRQARRHSDRAAKLGNA